MSEGNAEGRLEFFFWSPYDPATTETITVRIEQCWAEGYDIIAHGSIAPANQSLPPIIWLVMGKR